MKNLYRILLAACIGLGLVVMALQYAQAKDGDTAPMTPSDVCVAYFMIEEIATDSASGAVEDPERHWEPAITRCDIVATADSWYADEAAIMVERSSQGQCLRVGPNHKSNCLRVNRQRNFEVAQRTHGEIESKRQEMRGGHR